MKDGRWCKNDEHHNASLDIRERYSCIICTRTDFQHNCMSYGFATIHLGATAAVSTLRLAARTQPFS